MEVNNQIIGSVAIYEKGKKSFERNFGQSVLKNQEKKVHDIKYQIGSISKLFTAVMLTQLQEQKQISFDEPLSNYFKEMPNAEKITLKQMLNHTSGLGDYVTKDDSLYFWLLKEQSQKEIYKEIKRQGVLFQPGDSMRYSNTAYYLLARILENKYKTDYASILYQQIAKPLGLMNTSASNAKGTNPVGNSSYRKMDSIWNKVDDFFFLNASGVGDIVSTTKDLNLFINALNDGKIISKNSFQNMKPDKNASFGLGLMRVPFYSNVGYGHGGDTYGTHCVISIFEEEDISIAYCINGEYYPTNDFAKDILSILFNRALKYPVFTLMNADTSQFSLISGTYSATDYPISLKIYNEGNQLKAQGTGQPFFNLSPLDTNTYEYKPVKIIIKFDIPNQSLIITQFGKSFILKKPNAQPQSDNSIADQSKFPSYTGNYHSDDVDIKIKVFIEKEKLQAQGDGQQAFPLKNIGVDKFEFKEAQIIIIFNKEKKMMLLIQGGKEFNFQKD